MARKDELGKLGEEQAARFLQGAGYTILTRNRGRNSTGVMTGMIEKLKILPELARLSITFDRGTEFAYYALLKQKLGMDSYFCNPQAPW